MKASQNQESSYNTCSVCHDDFDFFAYGQCNHVTCAKCIVKLKKFTDDPTSALKCPTCRRDLGQIVVMDRLVPFSDINIAELYDDPEYGFRSQSVAIQRHYRSFLKSFCPVCHEEKKSLSALNRHATNEHQLSYCDLCIRFARLLPCEFTPMSPAELIKHRRWDKVHKKGHPLCDFCQERFYELEDLIQHIRNCHFLCDLCIVSGNIVVFREQRELLTHYGDSHHLCNECRAQERISCFATADQLGLHRFQEHPNEVSRDPDAWLPVSFRLVRPSAMGTVSQPVAGSDPDQRRIAESTETGIRYRRPNPAEWTGDDFPSLISRPAERPTSERSAAAILSTPRTTISGGTTTSTETTSNTGTTSTTSFTLADVAFRGRQTRLTADDFPSLPGSNDSGPKFKPTWKTNASAKSVSGRQDSAALSTQVTTVTNQQSIPAVADFPTLQSNSSSSRIQSLLPPVSKRKTEKAHSKEFNGPLAAPNACRSNQPNPSGKKREDEHVVCGFQFDETGDRETPVYNHIQLASHTSPIPLSKRIEGNSLPKPASNDFPTLSGGLSVGRTQSNPSSTQNSSDPAKSKRTGSKSKPVQSHWEHSVLDPECVLYSQSTYVPPPDAVNRNRELIRIAEDSLFDYAGKTAFSRFADLSRRYSHKELTAVSYLDGLLGLVRTPNDTTTNSPTWIAPMIALLPDIGLQRALLRALQGQGPPKLPASLRQNLDGTRRIKEPILKPPAWAKEVISLLQCCQICGQVCLRSDMNSHKSTHLSQE